MARSVAGTSHRYLYERLGEKRFQELCGALLAHRFYGVKCYPVGQKDGGRDIIRKHDGRLVIYQVKWTNKPQQNPVAWLDSAISEEADNIRQLVQAGAEEYHLMTSVAGTAARDRGTMDKVDKILETRSEEFGIPMNPWWRSDIDASVDGAPSEIKWTYQEMLAGVDAVRYLIEADSLAAKDQRLRTLLLGVVATQWQEDSKVKFKQVELDTHDLNDLFIDVEAQRLAYPRRAVSFVQGRHDVQPLGGAAAYLLATTQPLTLVRGEPGQGKSTLGQYLCQVHRATFPFDEAYTSGTTPAATAPSPRLPLRVDLRDYATWLTGGDPFAEPDDEPSRSRRRRRDRRPGTIENFLAELIQARSDGTPTSVETVRDILERFPVLVVLDGLDEVAQERTRTRVVKEIDRFAARLGTNRIAVPQLVVTTRPNASGMVEPSGDTFETIALTRLSPSLRTSYLRKWAEARSIRGKDRRDLERTFRQRSGEPHILQLADNPMQLTILLYLMHKRGSSVPPDRTGLYSSYMETLLDREAAKTRAVEEHREDLEEVTAYLGWHLQSLAETSDSNGRLTTKSLRRALNDYLFMVDKDRVLVDDLFTAVTDRVWALTSKVQGTFEFDVQPLREYFAARFLNHYAGADVPRFDTSIVLRNLVRRAYWLNTSRFYAGFAKPNELAGHVEGLAEERDEEGKPRQVRLAAWALLTDGVFSARTRTQQSASALFRDDLSIRLLAHALDSDPETPGLTADRGGQQLAELLKNQLTEAPDSPLAPERMAILARVQEQNAFGAWWRSRMRAAAGGPDQATWLRLGTPTQAASRLSSSDIEKLDLSGDYAAAIAVGAGIGPDSGSILEQGMIRVILDGQCSDADATSASIAADILKVFAPQHHLRRGSMDGRAYRAEVGHLDTPIQDRQRQLAMTRLKAHDSRFGQLQKALRTKRGESGTTYPWGNSARALSDIVGPCWIAAEAAVIGAALPPRIRTGVTTGPKGSEPLGPAADYGRLLDNIRFCRREVGWWTDQFETHKDQLSRATWALALASAAAEDVVCVNLANLAAVMQELDTNALHALLASSSRIGASGLARRLRAEVLSAALSLSPVVALLVAHHVANVNHPADLPQYTADQLAQAAAYGLYAWPALRAATARMIAHPSQPVLSAIRRFGTSAAMPPLTVQWEYDDHARSILTNAAEYPLAWVLASEQHVSQRAEDEPLATVATRNEWFAL